MATIPSYAMRDLRFLLKEVRLFEAAHLIVSPHMARLAEKIQGFIAPRKRFPKDLPGDSLDEKRQRKLRERRRASDKLHREVMSRPGWRCELGAHRAQLLEKIDLHHLIAGSAKRALQSVQNCLRACTACHREWHRKGAERFRARVLGWCVLNDYPVPPIFRRAPR